MNKEGSWTTALLALGVVLSLAVIGIACPEDEGGVMEPKVGAIISTVGATAVIKTDRVAIGTAYRVRGDDSE